MKKIKKIKIKLNGKGYLVSEKSNLLSVIAKHKVPIDKVAVELNKEIIDKKKAHKLKLKNNDKIEIVHFIGGG